MRMFGPAMFALPVAGALLAAGLGGCGGGSGTQSDRQAGQASQGVAVGEPAPTLALGDFITQARAASCNETRNRLYLIAGKQVLRDHAGYCADASYEQVLTWSPSSAAVCRSNLRQKSCRDSEDVGGGKAST